MTSQCVYCYWMKTRYTPNSPDMLCASYMYVSRNIKFFNKVVILYKAYIIEQAVCFCFKCEQGNLLLYVGIVGVCSDVGSMQTILPFSWSLLCVTVFLYTDELEVFRMTSVS